MSRTVGTLASPVTVYRQATLLRSALPDLARGRPVVVESAGEHFLLLPRAAVGHWPTRRLDDLPLLPTSPLPFATAVNDALDQVSPEDPPFVAVERDSEIVGVVSRESLLAEVAADAGGPGGARDRLVMLGEFAGAIAHDFNNLLTVTLGQLAIVDRSLPKGSRGRDHLDEIAKATDRAAALVRQLLAFGSRELVRPFVVDLRETLRDLHGLLTRLIGEDIELTLDIAPDLKPVTAAPVQIERVLANLVVNARHAMPDGGTLTITAANHGDDRVRISVEDTGVGIAPELLPRIFEPYFTTRRGKGSGLGLATVHGTVTQLGGTIAVDSTPGAGTRFDIDLHAADSASDEPAVAPPNGTPAYDDSARVLVVEDDAPVADAIGRLLEDRGHTVATVEGVDAARAAITEQDEPGFDLVITDLILRRGKGTELLEWLRDHAPNVRTILTSGYIGSASASALATADAVLPKPFSPEQLDEAMARAFAAARPT